MSQIFPALLIGGYPNRGKSILSYILSKLLLRGQSPHYLLRATPDGEGNWFQEAALPVAQGLRASHKRPWDAHFESALERVIAQRPLPFLVDVGGKPTDQQQLRLFSLCTHAILLASNESELAEWQQMAERFHLEPIAYIESVLGGEDAILEEGSPLRLRLADLTRQRAWQSASSDAWHHLVGRVQGALAWDAATLWQHHRLVSPPGTLPLNMEQWWGQRTPVGAPWSPALLSALVAELPVGESLAIYGARPVWLIAAIAAHSTAPLFTFDARYGWLPIPHLTPSEPNEPSPWQVTVQPEGKWAQLAFTLATPHLAPHATLSGLLPCPADPTLLVIDGKLPGWLFAALTHFYQAQGYSVAIADPRAPRAIKVTGSDVGSVLPKGSPHLA